MKPTTEKDYHRRVARVVEWLSGELDAPFDLERLASIACFSPTHFHRIYTAIAGETVAETVRRLRLHRAASDLRDDLLPLERIAWRAGYGGLPAFSRAFKSAYGLPPTRWRAERRFDVAPPSPEHGTEKMIDPSSFPVDIRELPAMRLAVVSHVGPYMEIGGAFARLQGLAGARGLFGPDTRMLGVYLDDPTVVAARELRSEAGITVGNDVTLDLPLGERLLGRGRHAVWTHRGPYADLAESYRRFYGEWLPSSGLEPADGPCFEIYVNDPRTTAPTDLLTEICLPLVD